MTSASDEASEASEASAGEESGGPASRAEESGGGEVSPTAAVSPVASGDAASGVPEAPEPHAVGRSARASRGRAREAVAMVDHVRRGRGETQARGPAVASRGPHGHL